MLLELRHLSQRLQAANVTVGQQDDHLVAYSRTKSVFRVSLSATGDVREVSQLAKDVVARLVKYEVSKGGARESAPGFNVPPLFIPADEDVAPAVAKDVKALAGRLKRPPKTDSADDRREALDDLISRCSSGWTEKAEALAKCLGNATRVLAACLEQAQGSDREPVAPLVELLRRAGTLTPDSLREQLIAAARRVVIDGTGGADAEAVLQWMFTKDGVVLPELADWTGTPANHETVWQAVNRILLAGRAAVRSEPQPAGEPTTQPVDAFGEPYRHNSEKMPERKLPRLGNVKLRSNSKSKPCQSRYGWVEGESFPVSLELRSSLADSLVWLTAEEREGCTFRDISSACGFDLPALLFAYPDPLPAKAPTLAAVLAKAGQQVQALGETAFVAAAELVVRELDVLRGQTPNAKVTLFVLAKRDTARTKLLFSRQFSADRIAQAVGEWKMAASNHPPVSIRLYGEDKKPRWTRCDGAPYPSDVTRCLNRVWQRGGERAEVVPVFDFGSALTLILDDGPLLTELAGRALRLAVEQWTELLLAMGQAATFGQVCPHSPNEQRLLPPILGLLLAKLGHRKDVYMTALPYWLGRLLAAADRLHRNYCDIERDRQYPPQLIGNAAMPACLENPQAGLARLAERLPLYQRLAGEDLRREVAEIISRIDHDNLPSRATDEHKAQMLLGYLARPDLLRPEAPPETQP